MIYDIKEFLKNFFSSRLFVLSSVIIILFALLLGRVFSLQIVNGKYYQENFELDIQKSLPIEATRGNIYDCNGELLAYNKLAYSVVISDTGSYENNKTKNELFNQELAEIIGVLKKNNETIYNDFNIILNDDGQYEFNLSGTALNRFRADVFGQASYDNLKYDKELGFDQANATADDIIRYLSSSKSGCFNISENYDKFTTYYIVVLRYAIKSNSFSKYKTTTIATDVSEKTVAYMNEHSDSLEGVSIKEDTIRKYNDSVYFAPIIGYTGKISTDEYNTLKEEDDTYSTNDTVGKSGLEKKYEGYLRGINGEQEFYVNNTGKITEIISTKESKSGSDLYLTIDKEIQKSTYLLLEQEIAGIVYSKIRSGDIPINDVYFALLNNNVLDITHFNDDNASKNEKALYNTFSSVQKSVLSKLDKQLRNSPKAINDMPEDTLDYFTYVITMLKNNSVLLSSEIDTNDSTYLEWKDGKISPQEYLRYCISMKWIDISLLSVDQKYADTSEIFDSLCKYIDEKLTTDKGFSKLIYKYMVESGSVTGKDLCLLLFDQGVLDYDEATVNNLINGTTLPYTFILDKINNIEITPAQLALDPCTGSCVITDIKTGEIKALVSYPGFDNNRLANGVDAAYYAALTEDNSNPLYNYATQERTAPGSTFKMVSSTAALAENIVGIDDKITCTGIFQEVENGPKCWKWPNGNHGPVNVSEALRDSCNIYYYTVGYELAMKDTGTYNDESGMKYLQKYAKVYGLDQKTGLEIEENQSTLATTLPIVAAIGQSDNNITTVALSRYVTAVASGKLYNYQLMKKIVDVDGNELEGYKPTSTSVTNVLSTTEWDAIHRGMRMVCENLDSFNGFDIEIAGKTGTAQQVETRPNHALFVGYVPYDKPEISIAVRIAYGYSSHNAASAARNIVSWYYHEKTLDEILDDKASGVNTSASDTRTD